MGCLLVILALVLFGSSDPTAVVIAWVILFAGFTYPGEQEEAS